MGNFDIYWNGIMLTKEISKRTGSLERHTDQKIIKNFYIKDWLEKKKFPLIRYQTEVFLISNCFCGLKLQTRSFLAKNLT